MTESRKRKHDGTKSSELDQSEETPASKKAAANSPEGGKDEKKTSAAETKQSDPLQSFKDHFDLYCTERKDEITAQPDIDFCNAVKRCVDIKSLKTLIAQYKEKNLQRLRLGPFPKWISIPIAGAFILLINDQENMIQLFINNMIKDLTRFNLEAPSKAKLYKIAVILDIRQMYISENGTDHLKKLYEERIAKSKPDPKLDIDESEHKTNLKKDDEIISIFIPEHVKLETDEIESNVYFKIDAYNISTFIAGNKYFQELYDQILIELIKYDVRILANKSVDTLLALLPPLPVIKQSLMEAVPAYAQQFFHKVRDDYEYLRNTDDGYKNIPTINTDLAIHHYLLNRMYMNYASIILKDYIIKIMKSQNKMLAKIFNPDEGADAAIQHIKNTFDPAALSNMYVTLATETLMISNLRHFLPGLAKLTNTLIQKIKKAAIAPAALIKTPSDSAGALLSLPPGSEVKFTRQTSKIEPSKQGHFAAGASEEPEPKEKSAPEIEKKKNEPR